MRAYLEESNQDLLYQIAVVQELLGKTSICGELTPYVGQVIQLCEALRRQAQRNLTDLGYGLDDTLNDILAATQSLTNVFEVVNTRLAAPVVRARPEDRLGLLVLRFLHDSNLNVGFAHRPNNDAKRHPTFQNDCYRQSFRKRMP